jgi:hypothetical protein
MIAEEIVGREAARFQQRDRQRVAHHELQQRRCRRRQAVRTGLLRLGQQQHDISLARQRRIGARRQATSGMEKRRE